MIPRKANRAPDGVRRQPENVIDLVEEAAGGPVLIVGALPPEGRDYDLLAFGPERMRLRTTFEAAGFRGEDALLRVAHGRAEIVDLAAAEQWKVPEAEVRALFARSVPLTGCERLRKPEPADELLVLARKLPRTPGMLSPSHAARIRAAVAASPSAWQQAAARAPGWAVRRRLARLRARSTRHPEGWTPPWWRWRPRRGAVVALSGLDGAGKSTQARALASALQQLGHDAGVVWVPFGSNARVRRLASAGKRALSRLPVGPYASADPERVEARWLSRPGVGVSSTRGVRRSATVAWSTLVAVTNALALRRAARGTGWSGRIVVFDRYVLDTVVELRFSYAPDRRVRPQEDLVRLLAPTPRCAFLLDVPVSAAHVRKPDWTLEQTALRARLYESECRRLGVHRIDGERTPDAVTAELLDHVLRVLR